MGFQRYCKHCQDYIQYSSFQSHMKQHTIGDPSIVHQQYSGFVKDETDYFICVLHQKKTPCPVKSCNGKPFGVIRKSLMMHYIKKGIFPDMCSNDQVFVKINQEDKTVILAGATIHLRF